MNSKKDNNALMLFQNYDLYETEGAGGKSKAPSPGAGLYQNMGKYKSVSDFLKKKRRARKRRKMAMLLAIAFPQEVKGKQFKVIDENDLQDPYEDQGITPLAPLSPAEVSPIGLLDSAYPKEDFEGKTNENLYYGRLESHEYAVDDGSTDSKPSKATNKNAL